MRPTRTTALAALLNSSSSSSRAAGHLPRRHLLRSRTPQGTSPPKIKKKPRKRTRRGRGKGGRGGEERSRGAGGPSNSRRPSRAAPSWARAPWPSPESPFSGGSNARTHSSRTRLLRRFSFSFSLTGSLSLRRCRSRRFPSHCRGSGMPLFGTPLGIMGTRSAAATRRGARLLLRRSLGSLACVPRELFFFPLVVRIVFQLYGMPSLPSSHTQPHARTFFFCTFERCCLQGLSSCICISNHGLST